MFFFSKKVKEKAFSLIELLVVVALLTIILSVSIFNYDNFGKDIELENAVYSVALAVREAQVFGINKALKEVSEPENSFGGEYGYGVFFSKTADSQNTYGPKKFVLFIDEDNNRKFDQSPCVVGNECYSQILLNKGNYIYELEYQDTSGNWINTDSLDIYFKRPNPEAIITNDSNTTVRSAARINITDPSGSFKRCVIIGSIGNISISSNCN